MPRAVSVASESARAGPEVVDVSSDEDDVVPLGPLWGPAVHAGAPPLRFRDYQRGRELGGGASGRVFVCSRQGVSGSFAVKTVDLRRLQLQAGLGGDRERAKLNREVEILRALPSHRGIVQMFDSFSDRNWFFMILELVEGGDLFAALTSRRPSRFQELEAAYVLRQVVDGLTFLHGHNVIHRDVKLENVLVASEQRLRTVMATLFEVKLTDFGLSKMVGLGRSEPHSFVGTRPYMAPEVEDGSAYDFASDAWCLGVLLFVLIVGKFPFDRVPKQQSEVDRVVQKARRSAGVTAKAVISGLLQLEPAARWTLEALSRTDWLHGDMSPSLGPSVPTLVPFDDSPDRQSKRQRMVNQEVLALDADLIDVAASPP